MGLIEKEIIELRDLVKQVASGDLPLTNAAAQLSIYNQVYKRERLMFDLWKTAAKQKNIMKKAQSKNLLTSEMAIDCGECPVKLVCSEKGGRLISEDECLEYSGEQRNIDSCQDCQNFSITRKKMF